MDLHWIYPWLSGETLQNYVGNQQKIKMQRQYTLGIVEGNQLHFHWQNLQDCFEHEES